MTTGNIALKTINDAIDRVLDSLPHDIASTLRSLDTARRMLEPQSSAPASTPKAPKRSEPPPAKAAKPRARVHASTVDEVYKAIAARVTVGAESLRKDLGLTKPQVESALKRLFKEGRISKSGSKRSTVYAATNGAAEAMS